MHPRSDFPTGTEQSFYITYKIRTSTINELSRLRIITHSLDHRRLELTPTWPGTITGAPNEKNIEKRFKSSFLLSHIVLWSFKGIFVRANKMLICSDVVAENSSDRKL